MNPQTPPPNYRSDRINDLYASTDGRLSVTVAPPKTAAPPSVRSIEWVDALAESWERRASEYEENCPNDERAHYATQGVTEELRACIKELRACAESASTEKWSDRP